MSSLNYSAGSSGSSYSIHTTSLTHAASSGSSSSKHRKKKPNAAQPNWSASQVPVNRSTEKHLLTNRGDDRRKDHNKQQQQQQQQQPKKDRDAVSVEHNPIESSEGLDGFEEKFSFDATINSASYPSAVTSSDRLVRLYSSNDEICLTVTTEIADLSPAMKLMLSASFVESSQGEIHFPTIRAQMLMEIVQFLNCKIEGRSSAHKFFGGSPPESIAVNVWLELLSNAHFLDLADLMLICAQVLSQRFLDLPPLKQFPDELLLLILQQLPPHMLYIAERKLRQQKRPMKTRPVWMKLFEKKFRTVAPSLTLAKSFLLQQQLESIANNTAVGTNHTMHASASIANLGSTASHSLLSPRFISSSASSASLLQPATLASEESIIDVKNWLSFLGVETECFQLRNAALESVIHDLIPLLARVSSLDLSAAGYTKQILPAMAKGIKSTNATAMANMITNATSKSKSNAPTYGFQLTGLDLCKTNLGAEGIRIICGLLLEYTLLKKKASMAKAQTSPTLTATASTASIPLLPRLEKNGNSEKRSSFNNGSNEFGDSAQSSSRASPVNFPPIASASSVYSSLPASPSAHLPSLVPSLSLPLSQDAEFQLTPFQSQPPNHHPSFAGYAAVQQEALESARFRKPRRTGSGSNPSAFNDISTASTKPKFSLPLSQLLSASGSLSSVGNNNTSGSNGSNSSRPAFVSSLHRSLSTAALENFLPNINGASNSSVSPDPQPAYQPLSSRTNRSLNNHMASTASLTSARRPSPPLSSSPTSAGALAAASSPSNSPSSAITSSLQYEASFNPLESQPSARRRNVKTIIDETEWLLKDSSEDSPLHPLEISLRENSLGDSGWALFGQFLPFLNLQNLDVSHNSLGERGALILAECIRRTSSWNMGLCLLNVGYCSLGNRGVALIFEALASTTIGCQVHTLDVAGNTRVGEENHATTSLVRYLQSASITTLTSLSLCGNSFPEQALNNTIPYFTNATNLVALDMSEMELGTVSAELLDGLCETLSNSALSSLRSLSLADNRMPCPVTAICAQLIAANTALASFDLSGNHLDSYTAAAFGAALGDNSHLKCLSVAGFSDGKRMRAEGFVALMRGLMNNTSLTSLDVSYHGIRNGGVTALCEIWHTTALRFVKLQRNHIDDLGAIEIAHCLQRLFCFSSFAATSLAAGHVTTGLSQAPPASVVRPTSASEKCPWYDSSATLPFLVLDLAHNAIQTEGTGTLQLVLQKAVEAATTVFQQSQDVRVSGPSSTASKASPLPDSMFFSAQCPFCGVKHGPNDRMCMHPSVPLYSSRVTALLSTHLASRQCPLVPKRAIQILLQKQQILTKERQWDEEDYDD